MAIPPTDPELADRADRLGHELWEVSTMVGLRCEAALSDTRLSLSSNGMLDTIGAHPGITIAEIARRLPVTQQAVSQVAARLQKLGYLERRVGPGRGVGLHLTAAGRRASQEGNRREQGVEAGLRERLGAARYDDLRRLLDEARELLREDA